MNALTKQTALIPANISQAMELAKMISTSKLVPKDLWDKPADCLLVVEQAMRWGMSPFAVAQCTSVIHGKLMYEGKLVAAVVNSSGLLSKRLSYTHAGEGDARTITVSGRISGETEDKTITLNLKDAKTTNEMWKKQPEQQLVYAGTRVWARRHTPELMLGVYTPDEIDDNRSQVADAVPIVSVPVPSPDAAPVPKKDPQVIIIPYKDEKPDWMTWGATLAGEFKAATSQEELEDWALRNSGSLTNCEKEAPMIRARLKKIFSDRFSDLHADEVYGVKPTNTTEGE